MIGILKKKKQFDFFDWKFVVTNIVETLKNGDVFSHGLCFTIDEVITTALKWRGDKKRYKKYVYRYKTKIQSLIMFVNISKSNVVLKTPNLMDGDYNSCGRLFNRYKREYFGRNLRNFTYQYLKKPKLLRFFLFAFFLIFPGLHSDNSLNSIMLFYSTLFLFSFYLNVIVFAFYLSPITASQPNRYLFNDYARYTPYTVRNSFA